MITVAVSSKFQVVIPREIRESLDLRPGQRLQAFRYGDRVELVPVRSLAHARGMLGPIDSDIRRDQDRL